MADFNIEQSALKFSVLGTFMLPLAAFTATSAAMWLFAAAGVVSRFCVVKIIGGIVRGVSNCAVRQRTDI